MSNDIDDPPAARLDGRTPLTKDIERRTSRAMQLRAQGRHLEAARMLADVAALLPNQWLPHYNAGAVFLEAGSAREAVPFFASAVTLHPTADGHAILGHALALQGDNAASRRSYERAVELAPRHFDAHWGLFEVDQLLGDDRAALEHQTRALVERTLVTIPATRPPARTTILELCIAGTFQANIPLDFILDREHVTVHKLYLGAHPVPPLPPYDIVFNTIAAAPNASPALRAAQAFIAGQTRPALNAPRSVPLTARDAVGARFASSATVAAPATRQVNRMTVHAARPAYPFLIRPLDSHAGKDLAKIDDGDALQAYLESVPREDEFFVCDFVDYKNADGFYRKYRIVFVDGVPYPVHLAISPRWMIHYYNAPMADHAWMRDEEHAFMRDLTTVFTGRAADGLLEIAASFPLEYFGIDCSIAADGRVLLFEASTAMIVHLRDPVALYPYKAQYVPRVVAALERLLDERLGRTVQS